MTAIERATTYWLRPPARNATPGTFPEPALVTPARITVFGDYPPRLCGIATFTRDLCEALSEAAPGSECHAAAVNDNLEGYAYPARVRYELQEKDLNCYRRVADQLNFDNVDVLCVQHEFGIYGGPAGSHLLALLKEVRMPVVTTLHTVLQHPDHAQRKVMEELAKWSRRLVVMAEKGAEILREVYQIPDSKIEVIPHGIADIPRHDPETSKAQLGVEGRTVLLTYGLIGPGKGIEHVIEALPEIVAAHPQVVYLVLGATHPHLLAQEGERYRRGLEWLAEERGVKEHVIFYNRYVTSEDLKEFIRATDIYLTPYQNEAQITSGTLAQVFGAGKAVISTPYWHARELLSDGKGSLVPFGAPAEIAAAVQGYLDDPARLERVRREAWAAGREMIWPVVARRYLECFRQVCREKQAAPRTAFGGWTAAARPRDLPAPLLDHVARMTDGTGIFQHALFTVPDFSHGYCTDDNARALILGCLHHDLGSRRQMERVKGLSTVYLAFLSSALNRDSRRFRNFMGFDRRWLEDAGSEDSHGRALWALGTGVSRSQPPGQRALSKMLFEMALPTVTEFHSPRAWTFSLLGLHEFLRAYPEHKEARNVRSTLTGELVRLWNECATELWPWFEPIATYDNARLSQALILGGHAMPHSEALEIGLTSLRWLVSIQKTPSGCFRPIGSNGFYHRDGARADYDQQPVEAQAMVSACLDASRVTGDSTWEREARRAFEWFLGRNDLGQSVYDAVSGGCSDGLHPDRVNENQGAESTLAFHLALAEMLHAEHPFPTEP